jgi:hypothetical protein
MRALVVLLVGARFVCFIASACPRHATEAAAPDDHDYRRGACHQDVRTTTIYTHVLSRGGRGVRSPFDI